jgi:hypothetical protein
MSKIIEEQNIKNKELSIKNAKAYKNGKSKMTERTVVDAQGKTKIKEIQQTTYENGVVKNRLVGMTKDGERIF